MGSAEFSDTTPTAKSEIRGTTCADPDGPAEAPTDMSEIAYIRLTDFDQATKKMYNTGGAHRRRAEKLITILGRLQIESDPLKSLKTTKHGETRVRHCIKYDLGDGYRLITIHSKKVVAFCFAGTHQDCDGWLDSHSGLTISKGADGTWQPIYQSAGLETPIRRAPSPSSERLLQRLEPRYLDALFEEVSAAVVLRLNELGTMVTSEDLERECASIVPPETRQLVYDVLSQLASGRVHHAVARLELQLGSVQEVDKLQDEEIVDIVDGDQIRRVPVGSDQHKRWLEHFARTADSMDWLLFLHPEQRAAVDADFSGPAQLSGVSGSGKTCVAIHRALRLANISLDRRVLVVTLNKSLAGPVSWTLKGGSGKTRRQCGRRGRR